MDLEIIMLSEIRQLEKEKYHIYYLYVKSNEENKMTNKINRQRKGEGDTG